MKKNNFGFMLAELVIVSGVVIVAIFSLYTGFSKVFVSFKEQSKYYSVDAMYMARNMMTFFIDENMMNKMINRLNSNAFIDAGCGDITIYGTPKQQALCNDLKNTYNANKIYMVKKSSIDNVINIDGINQTFKDYLTFFKNNESSMADNSEHYYFIVETHDLYYGSLKIS